MTIVLYVPVYFLVIIRFRDTTNIWKEGTRAAFCSLISLGPAGVWTTISTDPKLSIGIIIFPTYKRSLSEAGLTVWNQSRELHTWTVTPESRIKVSHRL